MRILGIDPGSRLTGFGCVEVRGREIRHIASGTLRLSSGRGGGAFEARLLKLFDELERIISRHRPSILVVEKVFFAKNALSALKLGQARGVVLVAGARHSLDLAEYSPAEVKQAVTGSGQADKEQVLKMVRLMTGHESFASHDASDALALALCHARGLSLVPSGARAKWQEAETASRSAGGRGKRQSLADALGHAISDQTPSASRRRPRRIPIDEN